MSTLIFLVVAFVIVVILVLVLQEREAVKLKEVKLSVPVPPLNLEQCNDDGMKRYKHTVERGLSIAYKLQKESAKKRAD